MDHKNHRVTLYTLQSEIVLNAIQTQGASYVKKEYIRQKYGETAPLFLGAYEWYTAQAAAIVPKPDEAESAFWTFLNHRMIERHQGFYLLELSVPEDQVIYFSHEDWNRILNYRYLGKSEKERTTFGEKLAKHGVVHESDVFFTGFYPLFKKELIESWQYLFQYDPLIKSGELSAAELPDLRCGLWTIQKEWVVSTTIVA